MKESSKKKLVHGFVMWKKFGDDKLANESRCPEMEATKSEIAMGDCVKSDLERVGEEWKIYIDRRNWRLLKENVVRGK